jgi:hypothetical protein
MVYELDTMLLMPHVEAMFCHKHSVIFEQIFFWCDLHNLKFYIKVCVLWL